MDHLADPWTDRFGPAIRFEDFIDCGDWVVAPWSGRLHGHGSGIEIDVSETYAVLVRDGRSRGSRSTARSSRRSRPWAAPEVETAPPGERGRFLREE